MSKVVSIRFSDKEYRLIMSRAVRLGIPLSEYIRNILLRSHDKKRAV